MAKKQTPSKQPVFSYGDYAAIMVGKNRQIMKIIDVIPDTENGYKLENPKTHTSRWVSVFELKELTEEEKNKMSEEKKIAKEPTYIQEEAELMFPVEIDNPPIILEKKDNLSDIRELSAKMEEASKKGKQEKAIEIKAQKEAKKVEKQQSFSIDCIPSDEGRIVDIHLSQLIPLDSTPIKNARYAMREIDKSHVEHLFFAYENGNTLPSIEVFTTSLGYVVVNGYHRWAAMKRLIEESCEFNEEKAKFAAENMLIPVKLRFFEDETAIINEAFKANLTNGLPMSDGSRSRYALWLIEKAKEHGEILKIRPAARMAGVSHVAVSRMAKRIADKENKMVDSLVATDEDVALVHDEWREQERTQETDTLKNASKRLFSSLAVITEILPDDEKLFFYWKEHWIKDVPVTSLETLIPVLQRLLTSITPVIEVENK